MSLTYSLCSNKNMYHTVKRFKSKGKVIIWLLFLTEFFNFFLNMLYRFGKKINILLGLLEYEYKDNFFK